MSYFLCIFLFYLVWFELYYAMENKNEIYPITFKMYLKYKMPLSH